MEKIQIKKLENADTRTCDWSKVTKSQLLKNSRSHISDVRKGMRLFGGLIAEAAKKHDYTKIENIDQFHEDVKTGFETVKWWGIHQRKERHHFKTPKYIQKDVNLIDILEQLIDGVIAGMARSGKYRKEVPDPKLLLKAYENTAKLLLAHVEVSH